MDIIFVNKVYSWKTQSLISFLKDGHIPFFWTEFFLDNFPVLEIVSKRIEDEKYKDYSKYTIYPPINWTFRAFINPEDIRVVIIGQDPYHNGESEFECSAVGYCFSVQKGRVVNPSLKNIYKEVKNSGYECVENGNLEHWVRQGVFMLNMSLTVEKGNAGSHSSFWRCFSIEVVKYLSELKNIVWLLMGRHAINTGVYIEKGVKICTSHPSPLSCRKPCGKYEAFIGSKVFRKINDNLTEKIVW